MSPSRRLGRRNKRLARSRQIKFESLEARHLLTGGLVSSGIDSVELDPNVFDGHDVLVRFADQAVSSSGDVRAVASDILPGSRAVPLMDGLPNLQRVQLPDGVGVEQALALFRGRSDVVYAEPNYHLQSSVIPDDGRFIDMWALENEGQTGGTVDADIDASGAWDVHTGSGSLVIAVIDTGVNWQHPDLADNMWLNADEVPGDHIDNDGNGYVDDVYGYDFINRDSNPMDDMGHGTHVAGTIGAVGNNGLGVTGVNWDIQIMGLKFLGSDGAGTTADAIEAINYAVANGAQISNNSWGGDPYSQAMFDALEAAANAGHLFVTASGNGDMFGIGINNDVSPFYPAGYEVSNVLAVAAVDHQDQLASFSNYGANSVDLAAPGVNILSTTYDGGYGQSSGTSMATPHVAGAAALVWDAHPDWSYTEVVAQLLDTVDVLPGLQGVVASNGRLNLANALDNPQPGPPPPPPGTLPLVEGFQDNEAEYIDARSGRWSVSYGRYRMEPSADDDNLATIATLRLDTAVPTDFELRAYVNAEEGRSELFGILFGDHLTNGLLIFDYHDQQDFKFAGADMDENRWMIGHRDASGWSVDASLAQPLSAGTDYQLKLIAEGDHNVTLWADGEEVLSHAYADSISDGDIGVGGRNSTAYFDNLVAQAYTSPAPTSLPLSDDFETGAADYLVEQSGISTVDGGELHMLPFAGTDAVSTILLDDPLPTELEVQATFNADDATDGRLSNAFLVFDYQSATDFKFAGAFVGINQWVIGHRSANDWEADAVVDAPISATNDYDLQVTLKADGTMMLLADSTTVLSYQYGDSLTDGLIGFGTKDALARFDNLSVDVYTPSPTTTMPFAEDFDNGVAEFLESRSGMWLVQSQRYAVTPPAGGDGVSTVQLEDVPSDFQVLVTANVDPGSNGRLSNGFVIFDYHDATDFKFAGAYAGSDQWIIGHRDSLGWVTDAMVSSVVDTLIDYRLRLDVANDTEVTLYVDGVPQLSHSFGDSLRDGDVGVGTREATARFDDLQIEDLTAGGPFPGELPLAEDFEDGVADHLALLSGLAGVSNGRYPITPHADSDGLTTLLLADPLPANVTWEGTFNADGASSGRLSNAFLTFDYVSPTNFKFAGAFVGINQWVIGHRNATDWVTDVYLDASINELTDYHVQVTLEAGGKASLAVDGAKQLSYDFGESLTDGDLGLGAKNALARYDDLGAAEYTPPPTASLPFAEDFDDSVADFFDVQAGEWNASTGLYMVTPAVESDGVSTVRLDSIPDDFEIVAQINADAATNGRLSNAFVIFDYEDAFNFKFAGAYAGSDQWLIGHRDAGAWQTDASMGSAIDAGVDYELRVTILADSDVTLYVDGIPRISHSFVDSLKDGAVGVGVRNAISRFDDVAVRELVTETPPAGSLPMAEDFDDGVADHLLVRSGFTGIGDGRYQVTPQSGGDGISTVFLGETLPGNIELLATMNADPATNDRLSNAFVIFDYVDATNFKFAGAYVGANQWLIGHRNASGWVTDSYAIASIDALTDYDLRLMLETDGTATLFVDGIERVSHGYRRVVDQRRCRHRDVQCPVAI